MQERPGATSDDTESDGEASMQVHWFGLHKTQARARFCTSGDVEAWAVYSVLFIHVSYWVNPVPVLERDSGPKRAPCLGESCAAALPQSYG